MPTSHNCLKQLYLLTKHRVYVMWKCWAVGIYWLGLIHDINKYIPWVILGYASYFRGSVHGRRDSTGYYKPYTDNDKFNRAIHYHITHSKHHWQYWCLISEANNIVPLDIPEKYIKEMLCDWEGAAYMNNNDPREWYIANSSKILLHCNVRNYIDSYYNIGGRLDGA